MRSVLVFHAPGRINRQDERPANAPRHPPWTPIARRLQVILVRGVLGTVRHEIGSPDRVEIFSRIGVEKIQGWWCILQGNGSRSAAAVLWTTPRRDLYGQANNTSMAGMNRDRIDQISYRHLLKAHRALGDSPDDATARRRFNDWCKAASRCLGLHGPLTAVEYDSLRLESGPWRS